MSERARSFPSFGSGIILYTALVVLSSPFGRVVYNYLISILGRDLLRDLIWFVLLAFAALVLTLVTRINLAGLVRLGLVLAVGAVYAMTFEIIEERMHLVIFGALGYLFARDNKNLSFWLTLVQAAVLGAVIGSVDESIQSITPGRVGDVRDVVFNTIGSIWGASIALAVRTKT